MIRVRELRFWTALLVMALAAFTIARSLSLLAYGVKELGLEPANVRERLGPFVDDPALGFLARRKTLELDRSDDAPARAASLEALLGLTPLSGDAWLELARVRLGAGYGLEKVASALAMSNVAAPNEAHVMAARAAFGLPLWRLLPPEERRSLIADLIGGWQFVGEAQRQALRAVFLTASEATRDEARAALGLAGREAAPMASALGLEAASVPQP